MLLFYRERRKPCDLSKRKNPIEEHESKFGRFMGRDEITFIIKSCILSIYLAWIVSINVNLS